MILTDGNIGVLAHNSDLWVATGSRERQAEIVQAMAREIQILRKTEEAATWTLNIVHGVSKSGAGIDPMDDEPEAAFEALKQSLAKYQALKEE